LQLQEDADMDLLKDKSEAIQSKMVKDVVRKIFRFLHFYMQYHCCRFSTVVSLTAPLSFESFETWNKSSQKLDQITRKKLILPQTMQCITEKIEHVRSMLFLIERELKTQETTMLEKDESIQRLRSKLTELERLEKDMETTGVANSNIEKLQADFMKSFSSFCFRIPIMLCSD
jgi:glutathione synthase/RimK-type ligase-like ATP-grasp enzyme